MIEQIEREKAEKKKSENKSRRIESLEMGGRTSRFESKDTAETIASAFDLANRRYLVTGGNCGLGLETVRVLVLRGAEVFCCVRRPAEMPGILQGAGLTEEQVARIRIEEVDLSSLESVRALAGRLRSIEDLELDGLVLNAGVMMLPEYRLTADGLETQWQINHLSHFALTLSLLPILLRGDQAEGAPHRRVVSVSSAAHQRSPSWFPGIVPPTEARYSSLGNYGISKLSNVLFAAELNRRMFASHRLAAVSLHPGVIPTELGRYNSSAQWFYENAITRLFMKNAAEGASTQVYCLLESLDRLQPGGYHMDNDVATCSSDGSSLNNAQNLWDVSMSLLAEKAPEISEWIRQDGLIAEAPLAS